MFVNKKEKECARVYKKSSDLPKIQFSICQSLCVLVIYRVKIEIMQKPYGGNP